MIILHKCYTIRAFRADTLEPDLDFVLHGCNGEVGLASTCAAKVSIGEEINTADSASVKRITKSERWRFIASALT